MSQPLVFSDEDRSAIRALGAEVQACLALSRATLRALAALSPTLSLAAEAALDEEADRATEQAAPTRTLEIVEEVKDRLQKAPAEAELTRALERVLVDAASALPRRADRAAA